MARPQIPNMAAVPSMEIMQGPGVSGNRVPTNLGGDPQQRFASSASAAVYMPNKVAAQPQTQRASIAKWWQIEAYRHINICGEARFAANVFAAMASRATLGIAAPVAHAGRAQWVTEGPEVDALVELAPSHKDRSKLIRDYMLHYIIAGECYLIARKRQEWDPRPEMGDEGAPIWEIVAVTEIRREGMTWRVRYDNHLYVDLEDNDPVIRLWNPDPGERREAWSPFRSLLPTLREIEWLTKHIFTQVRSRLMSAGVWFLPDNLTFPAPPVDSVEGGAAAIAQMNEAEQFMLSLASASMEQLASDEVAFPTIVMADPAALAAVDQKKLIQFWSNIDDKAMMLRTEAIRRFALGMDLTPEQVLGQAGLGGASSQGTRGALNHWGMWANEEQTISTHIEPALDALTGTLTAAFLRTAVEGTDKVIGYDTATLRLKQDRSKEAVEWYDRGILKAEVALRETGFDPENDMMDDKEHSRWLLNRLAGGSATPEQVQAALILLGVPMPAIALPGTGNTIEAPGAPGQMQPPSLDGHPKTGGKPTEDHYHNPAPYSILPAAEVLVLRALEKAGNRLLNDGKRGRDKDRTTPAHMAHFVVAPETTPDFDFSLLPMVFGDMPAAEQAEVERKLQAFCAELYEKRQILTRQALQKALS